MLFNEPKLLKSLYVAITLVVYRAGFSALQRAEIAEIGQFRRRNVPAAQAVSVLFNEPKLLKFSSVSTASIRAIVSVLFNEPKLLKFVRQKLAVEQFRGFSALQRAEIAEI